LREFPYFLGIRLGFAAVLRLAGGRNVAQSIELAVVDLVLRARRGDGAAFAELIRRHERLALGVAFGVLHDAQLASDVVQEAFLKAWKRLADLSQAGSFAAWLCGIVRNLSVDQKRRKRLAICGIEEARGEADGKAREPAEEMSRREQALRISAALESLDELTRSAVVLRYYENLSSKEIGDMLGLSSAAIDMRLMRGRQALKEKLVLEVNGT
jgi:RNA polymerase sigma factor (sigma-70 family)